MAEADLAIGAGGSSNWERCCLGLPSIVIATAANQVPISSELGRLGACLYLGSIQNTNLKEIKESIELFIFSQPELEKKSRIALSLTNGNGTCCVTQEMQNKMRVEILNSDKNHPIMSYLNDWGASRINVNIVHSANDLLGGYMLYLVACGEILSEDVIKKFKHALVLHASDVPIGRGWSPHIWSVLEGKNTLTVSLLEVESKVDRGAIWLKTKIKLKGHELLDEINDKLFKAELGLITKGMCAAQEISPRIQENVKSNYFPKRTPKGSRLNINKSLIDQFNLLRVADKDRYPAFFEYLGHKYIVNIEKASHEF
ncbi:MAG: hypothetical protein EXR35_08185 [Limnohabitans sp.]|nr:hypothetical protein [Limnohabitans sp.]